MTHKDKGNYTGKHPQNSKADENLQKEIKEKMRDGKIACADAEKIARKNNIAISLTGMTIDLLNIDINKCQLGLFGYSPEKKIVQPAVAVAERLKNEITKALVNDRLACAAAWEIAARLNIPRLQVASACEALQIKIKPCQLGAF